MQRPLIGLTAKLVADHGDAYYKLDRSYIDAIRAAGGEPLILPFVRTKADAAGWLDRIQGLVLTGGPDINPIRWKERLHPKAELMHADKEASDFHYAGGALNRDLPVLGICLGMQELNVALGGSLHQHIEGHGGGKKHPVEVTVSRLRDHVGGRPSVNSYHHQAVHRLGTGLKVTAMSDEVIEGIESDRHEFVIGVQWHPERIAAKPEQKRLFRAFVQSARS